MDRIWLAHYPPGVPAEIDPSRYSSLAALFEESFEKFGKRDAYISMGKRLTFAQIDEKSRELAAWFQSQGLQRGARIAIMMPNVLQYPIALVAVLRAGYVVVNVNPLYTPRELQHQLEDSGAEAIIVLENFAATVADVVADTSLKHIVIAKLGDLHGVLRGTAMNIVVRYIKKMVPAYSLPGAIAFNDALDAGRGHPFTPPKLGPEDLACLQYTGGTTGVAKGAMLVHRNLIANVLQAESWLWSNRQHAVETGIYTIIAALPLYHIFAFTACFMLPMSSGATTLLIVNPRDISALIGELRKYPPTMLPAVNTLFNALLNHPDFDKIDWSHLQCAVGGGMAVQKAVAEHWQKATGHPIIEAYGLSETAPALTANRPDITEWNGTIGFPFPSTEISIRDDAGNEMPIGEPGEICARGPQVMAGYWKRPDETARAMTNDGFFRTGDIGIMDDMGRTRIIDRKKDMILVSGFNVYPNEIEDVLASHPGVLEVAVIGVPDEHSGEAVKAFVVRKDPNLTAGELRQFAAAELTGYKIPRQIEFRDELPKTNVGKVLRRALREPARNQAT